MLGSIQQPIVVGGISEVGKLTERCSISNSSMTSEWRNKWINISLN